ncbi:hypothetical protein KHA80_09225 [Anaerobacillus sp. HL2]|nr:hypothetical protein KHA80_09225 [Anaerobacillus sp. HL2]
MNQGDEYISNIGRGGGIKEKIVGVDEAIFGGKITQLNLKHWRIADTFMNYGLDKFFAMIKFLSSKYFYLKVSLNIVFLPLGRKVLEFA